MAKHGSKILKGPFTLKINKHEDGMAVSIDPHLDKLDLAELMIGVIDAVLADTHVPITILIPKDKSQQVQLVQSAKIEPKVLATFLRQLADNI